jgi:hypothetical protein
MYFGEYCPFLPVLYPLTANIDTRIVLYFCLCLDKMNVQHVSVCWEAYWRCSETRRRGSFRGSEMADSRVGILAYNVVITSEDDYVRFAAKGNQLRMVCNDIVLVDDCLTERYAFVVLHDRMLVPPNATFYVKLASRPFCNFILAV